MLKQNYFFPAVLLMAITVIGCKATKSTSTTTTTTTTSAFTYNQHVKTIIDANCASSCHNAERPAAGINLTQYAFVKKEALEGVLIPAIQHAEGATAMPKKADKLSDADIQTIVVWAAGGAVE